AEARVAGRDIGTACHRFMEFADFRRLRNADEIRAQLAELIAGGRLSDEEATAVPVDDVAWFGQTAECASLAQRAEQLQREVAFAYALPIDPTNERILVRGVIDLLAPDEAGDGLTLLDYKTDRPADEADFERRVAGYRVQLQLYAQASAAIFGRPV